MKFICTQENLNKGLSLVSNISSKNSKTNDGLNDILEYIKQHPGINSRSVREKLEKSQRTVERWIKKLKDE